MNGLQLLILADCILQHAYGRLQVLILLVNVADVQVDLGPLVQVLDVLQNDVALH